MYDANDSGNSIEVNATIHIDYERQSSFARGSSHMGDYGQLDLKLEGSLPIEDFGNVVKRMARLLGYTDESISRLFTRNGTEIE